MIPVVYLLLTLKILLIIILDPYDKFECFMCSNNIVSLLIAQLPLNKSGGPDMITSEHLKYCDKSICEKLSTLFNACLYHCYLPLECLDTVLVPIVKNKKGNISDKNN